mmetsp:Transcript_13095/g.18394  ORF Transcript_13095/g.18394 Transcript_13095/m.18394 type:complete len:150 (-) Transcript_13095:35-484(-)
MFKLTNRIFSSLPKPLQPRFERSLFEALPSFHAQQSRERSSRRHVSRGYEIDLEPGEDAMEPFKVLCDLYDQDRHDNCLSAKEYYEKPARKRYRKEKSGKRNRKIGLVKSMVELTEWRREQGLLGAKNMKIRKMEKVDTIFPFGGPEGF